MSDLQGFGRVCIVGAGPGPIDRMTLRTLDRLQSAGGVVQHRLIGVDVLDRIPEATQRVYAGKALGNHAAAAGIPLTHRDFAGTWPTSRPRTTGGRWPAPRRRGCSTWASSGCRPEQTVLACPLVRMLDIAPAYGPQPGLLIIGETVQRSPCFQAA